MDSLGRDELLAAGALFGARGILNLAEQPDDEPTYNVSNEERDIDMLTGDVWANRVRRTFTRRASDSSRNYNSSTRVSSGNTKDSDLGSKHTHWSGNSDYEGNVAFAFLRPFETDDSEWTNLPSTFGSDPSLLLEQRMVELGAAEVEVCLGAYLLQFATQPEQELMQTRGPYGAIPLSRDIFNLSMKWKGGRYRHIFRIAPRTF
ncbi:unnamed protein product [Rhizoctonia solani]|uniref:Uncharacterized protein n=1 Tax=Rhizoctonia solani TaxID=456999 RepID=A0A8H2Y1U3_9AGAM|nr:unnamed protein product [Rhizoctonia solani]